MLVQMENWQGKIECALLRVATVRSGYTADDGAGRFKEQSHLSIHIPSPSLNFWDYDPPETICPPI